MCLFLQYVTKNKSELHQHAVPKHAPVLTVIDESDDAVERQVQRIPTIEPKTIPPQGHATVKAQPDVPTFNLATKDVTVGKNHPVSGVASGTSDETPHIHVDTDEAREARLDKQWKQLKVDVGDLPDIYARLAKIKLTGTMCRGINKIDLQVKGIRKFGSRRHLNVCIFSLKFVTV